MSSELVFSGGGRERTLEIVRRRGQRSVRLSVTREGGVRLSLPPRHPLKSALTWAAGKRRWVEAELARLPEPQPIVPGLVFEMEGEAVRLDWSPARSRLPRLDAGVLFVGGPREALAARVERWLKARALTRLTEETRSLATRHGIVVGKVAVGDPRGRWGSCSSDGSIRYSWRLILAPPEVLRATVAHEVAHRVHMDHSRAFHAQVAALFGRAPGPERRWLRANGQRLHWFGRST